MEERYFLRITYADGREETEYMEMEAAYHRTPQVMTEEIIARYNGNDKNVTRVCWGMEKIMEHHEF